MFITLDPFCNASAELHSRQLGKPWLDLDCVFPIHIGQKYAEKESTRSDTMVLRKASSWINSYTRKLLDSLHGLVLLSKPKIQFYLSCLAGSRVRKTAWKSKCRFNEIFNPSTLFSHCLMFLSVLKISGFSSSFSSENLLTVIISYCKKGWKIWHLNIITLWHVLPEQKLTPHTSQKQNPWKEQL